MSYAHAVLNNPFMFRSGSSFLGDLLTAGDKATYYFEPPASLKYPQASPSTNGSSQSTYEIAKSSHSHSVANKLGDITSSEQWFGAHTSMVRDFLLDIFNCNDQILNKLNRHFENSTRDHSNMA